MRVAVISRHYPMTDRAAGHVRLHEVLKLIREDHEVDFCACEGQSQIDRLGKRESDRYKKQLEDIRVRVSNKSPESFLRQKRYDVVLFEFYHVAERYIDEARCRQPGAQIIIDSVDVHFARLYGKAEVTNRQADYKFAATVKKAELNTYKKADLVIAASQEDRAILLREHSTLPVAVIPIIHNILPIVDRSGMRPESMIFVGNFEHEPNVDAMLYFCESVFPLIRKQIPTARLTIVGNRPPNVITQLASAAIEVPGYVKDTMPYLLTSHVSIAPLRYGGGMKGKIGEALACGLPVVTTSVGIQGFGLCPGKEVLVGDTPDEFALGVVTLMQSPELCEQLRIAGASLIRNNFSIEAVRDVVKKLLRNRSVDNLSKTSSVWARLWNALQLRHGS
jgi:glycosyltransferase involved in cell wall biosynthesis